MNLAALALWVVTALGGLFMLGIWITRGGPRTGATRLPVPALFGHFALAVAGLVVWIIYVIVDKEPLAWTAFGLLAVVALLGITMFARWISVFRARSLVSAGGGGGRDEQAEPPERHFPVPVVAGHGLLAVATLVVVLLATLGVGGS